MNDENKEFKKAVFESDEQTKGKEEARGEMVENIAEEIREEAPTVDQARITVIDEFLEEHYGSLRDDSPDKVIISLAEKLLEERDVRAMRAHADALKEEGKIARLRKANAALCETVAILDNQVAAWRRLTEDLEGVIRRMRRSPQAGGFK